MVGAISHPGAQGLGTRVITQLSPGVLGLALHAVRVAWCDCDVCSLCMNLRETLLLNAQIVVCCVVAAGVPIIADSKFMAAYSMIEPNAVFYQEDGKNELDVMFSVARMTPEEMWRTRLGEGRGLGWYRHSLQDPPTAAVAWMACTGICVKLAVQHPRDSLCSSGQLKQL